MPPIPVYAFLDLHTAPVKKQVEKVTAFLQQGDFRAADARKMTGTPYYRARLNDTDRLLFRLARHQGQTCLLLLEVVLNHAYDKSRFLRGAAVDESKLQLLPALDKADAADVQALAYVPPKGGGFRLLDKVLFFDEAQEQVLNLPVPLIIIGSAGSGKTALTLEKIKLLNGTEKAPARVLYVTLSAYLSENASRLYRSHDYDNARQEVDFLSFREFVETVRIPEGDEITFPVFRQWFERHRPYTKIKDAHRLFEEFRGVLTGFDTARPWLARADYLALGVRQSVFVPDERGPVYDLFEKYLDFLKENRRYDLNLVAFDLLAQAGATYDFIVVDEVQDLTNVQLQLILKSLRPGKGGVGFILCGDSHQIVHPNFFSWAKIKSMFYRHEDTALQSLHVLRTNYRNARPVTELANRLLRIKNLRFGSIDRESTYLVEPNSDAPGEVVFMKDTEAAKKQLNNRIRRSTRFAVLVMREEDKAAARRFFDTPLLFSVQEAKGLEYENIVLAGFVSENEKVFRDVAEGISPDELQGELQYGRAGREDKSLESYKFFVNSLYVAITRAMRNIYVIESREKHELLALLGLTQFRERVEMQVKESTDEEWRLEARKLELQGKTEQAEAIRKQILAQKEVPWEVITHRNLPQLRRQALDPAHYNKQAKDSLFEYALLYNDKDLLAEMAALEGKQRYGRAQNPPENERKALMRRAYAGYLADSVKEVAAKATLYGTDHRDRYNLTPLMHAALAGAQNTAAWLLANGADRTQADSLGRTPLQLVLLQTLIDPSKVNGKLGPLYDLLRTDSLSLRLGDHLVKVGRHKAEYLVILYLMVAQMQVIQRKPYKYYWECVNAADVEDFLSLFPDSVVPAFRKDRRYINAMMARNEANGTQPYNLRLWQRMRNGNYVVNPELQLLVAGEWLPAYFLMNAEQHTAVDGTWLALFWYRVNHKLGTALQTDEPQTDEP